MPKRTSAGNAQPTLNFVIVTLDSHVAGAVERAAKSLRSEIPGLSLQLHAAAEYSSDPDALQHCISDIRQAHIVLVTQLFMEDHLRPVMSELAKRRTDCDALVACMSSGEVVRLTRMGKFDMSQDASGPMGFIKKIRDRKKAEKGGAGEQEMSMLRRLPKILRFIPGTAQDVRAYFLALQYWLAGSEENMTNLVRFLAFRYGSGDRAKLGSDSKVSLPVEYPDVGLYHPRLKRKLVERVRALPRPDRDHAGTVGLVLMRSYPVAGNAGHYDGVIAAMEALGLRVIPAFASGLDARPAIERFFYGRGGPTVDAIVSLTGFPLVGGPAYNDADAAEQVLAEMNVPYIGATPLEFQTLEEWTDSERGLVPVEATMMVAIPELEGATGSMVIGGRSTAAEDERDMTVADERAEALAMRVARLIRLRRLPATERRLGIVLFNFPPNAGSTGSAAHLAVFESLYNVLAGLKRDGYDVDLPADVDALRAMIIDGNAQQYGTDANVLECVELDDHVRHEPWLDEVEAQWGPAPGQHLTDGRSLFIQGAKFGNVFVGVQPAFGYEGDPMRLLFERGFAPTHAFCAFYRYLRDTFAADAVLHFGTHGALEFMPGKQAGMSSECWPDRLIGALPNFYLYASNNPSEGAIAKRRSAATLVSYRTPSVTRAGLHQELSEFKGALDHWRRLDPEERIDHDSLRDVIVESTESLGMDVDLGRGLDDSAVTALWHKVLELEGALIPEGLHIVGDIPDSQERTSLLTEIASASDSPDVPADVIAAIATSDKFELTESDQAAPIIEQLVNIDSHLRQDAEIPALLNALNGGFVRPGPGGDLLRNPDVLPTGRNIHGFDPFRIPSAYACRDGRIQCERVLARHVQDGNGLPESVAMVLWATDNLKSEGAPLGQALSLLGARPRFDSYGRLTGAELIGLEELGRPRIDVVVTLSGMFRDLLPLQIKLFAEAAYLAATADEPESMNFVRKHALECQSKLELDVESSALRVFSNADGAYGSNLNLLVDAGTWGDESELGNTFVQRKGFAYDRAGAASAQGALLQHLLSRIELAYQNLESVELGVTTVDHYFDSLGGIHRVAREQSGEDVPVYIGDQTTGDATVRTLEEQVTLETHSRILNPKWYEGMLAHGFEGVRHIECHLTNTVGWSATTGRVAPWVYQQIAQTFVLDEQMRNRLAKLNPKASCRVANRLIEATDRSYWTPDEETLDALMNAGAELEDRLEGLEVGAAA